MLGNCDGTSETNELVGETDSMGVGSAGFRSDETNHMKEIIPEGSVVVLLGRR